MKLRRVSKNGKDAWIVDFYDGPQRHRRFFKRRIDADVFLHAKRVELEGGPVAPAMSRQEAAEFAWSVRRCRELGVGLRRVVSEWENLRSPNESVGLGAAVDALLAVKRAARLRPTYLGSLAQVLRAFAQGREAQPVASVDAAQVESWLDGRGYGPSSRPGVLGRLGSLFSFALRRRWIRENPLRFVERVKIERKPAVILSVRQARRVMRHAARCMPDFIPGLALMLFAGVRPAETERLGWSAVKGDVLHLDAAASKVRARRLVHLSDNCRAWLELGGRLPVRNRRDLLHRLAGVLGLARWPVDVLRHSAASYMLARDRDAARVALELGNSPATLFAHYRELVGEREAAIFWRIVPAHGGRPARVKDVGRAPHSL